MMASPALAKPQRPTASHGLYARLKHELHGRLYIKVRAELIRRGYHPILMRPSTEQDFCGGGFCERFPETLNCTGGGLMYCDFAFRSPDHRLVDIRTEGEGVITVVDVTAPEDWALAEIRDRRR